MFERLYMITVVSQLHLRSKTMLISNTPEERVFETLPGRKKNLHVSGKQIT